MYVVAAIYVGPIDKLEESAKILLKELAKYDGFIGGEVFRRIDVPIQAMGLYRWRSKSDYEIYEAKGAPKVREALQERFGANHRYFVESRIEYEPVSIEWAKNNL